MSHIICQSQWPRGLRRGSAAARFLGLWVRIPSGAWMSGTCECCVLLSKVPCVVPITRPREPYDCWAAECDREAWIMRRPWPIWDCCTMAKKKVSDYLFVRSDTSVIFCLSSLLLPFFFFFFNFYSFVLNKLHVYNRTQHHT